MEKREAAEQWGSANTRNKAIRAASSIDTVFDRWPMPSSLLHTGWHTLAQTPNTTLAFIGIHRPHSVHILMQPYIKSQAAHELLLRALHWPAPSNRGPPFIDYCIFIYPVLPALLLHLRELGKKPLIKRDCRNRMYASPNLPLLIPIFLFIIIFLSHTLHWLQFSGQPTFLNSLLIKHIDLFLLYFLSPWTTTCWHVTTQKRNPSNQNFRNRSNQPELFSKLQDIDWHADW